MKTKRRELAFEAGSPKIVSDIGCIVFSLVLLFVPTYRRLNEDHK